ncbi:hypothetical protein EMCRGX_G025309 [Ephydatia muelleri]|eukprot:Em0021g158a
MQGSAGSTQVPSGSERKQARKESTIFNDPIYGLMELDSLLVAIINTPEFDRLRYIKQLGGNYYVYPGASHNRFEHCIGVSFLAGKLIEALQQKTPHDVVQITDVDVLCVKVAGLCHDLGHGPYSHMFGKRFLEPLGNEVEHEELSCAILDKIYNAMKDIFEDRGLKEAQIAIIKELIIGKKTADPGQLDAENKRFMYEIVANKVCEIDVDKWDYFTRDCHALGLKHGFDYQRLLHSARVMVYEGKTRIVYRDKVIGDIEEHFYTRTRLHKAAYQHRVSCCIEIMIGEAFRLAHSGGYKFKYWDPTKQGLQSSTLLDAASLENLPPYLELTDNIVRDIMRQSHETASHPDLIKAREVLERVLRRKIYRYVGETSEDEYKAWIENPCEDFVIDVAIFEDKMNTKNILVYSKTNPDTPFPLSKILTRVKGQTEKRFRKYSKKEKEDAVQA